MKLEHSWLIVHRHVRRRHGAVLDLDLRQQHPGHQHVKCSSTRSAPSPARLRRQNLSWRRPPSSSPRAAVVLLYARAAPAPSHRNGHREGRPWLGNRSRLHQREDRLPRTRACICYSTRVTRLSGRASSHPSHFSARCVFPKQSDSVHPRARESSLFVTCCPNSPLHTASSPCPRPSRAVPAAVWLRIRTSVCGLLSASGASGTVRLRLRLHAPAAPAPTTLLLRPPASSLGPPQRHARAGPPHIRSSPRPCPSLTATATGRVRGCALLLRTAPPPALLRLPTCPRSVAIAMPAPPLLASSRATAAVLARSHADRLRPPG